MRAWPGGSSLNLLKSGAITTGASQVMIAAPATTPTLPGIHQRRPKRRISQSAKVPTSAGQERADHGRLAPVAQVAAQRLGREARRPPSARAPRCRTGRVTTATTAESPAAAAAPAEDGPGGDALERAAGHRRPAGREQDEHDPLGHQAPDQDQPLARGVVARLGQLFV